jgi:FtsP/CotA-like multicopper oxidase with cupredoxin domain
MRHGCAALCVLLCGCNASPEPSLEPVPLTDTNPAPKIVEVQLVAGPSKTQYVGAQNADVWAYRDGARGDTRGTVPGPLLRANQGDHVIVHFRNELPEETTIHWHGIRVPPLSDGTTAAQIPVAPGATFDYEFDALDAGTFWYHPHMRGDVQIEKGLYGMIVVRGGVEPDVAADRAFVLDDVKVEANGQLSTQTDPLDLMLGRQGNVLLVNGRPTPKLSARSGSRERWRFVNSANGRYFNLSLPGHSFLVIAWDGGLLAEPYSTDTLLIAPGERYEVLVELVDPAGSQLELQTLYYDRGHNIPDPGPQSLMKIDLSDKSDRAPLPLPAAWRTDEPIAIDAQTPTRSFVLSEQEEGLAEPRFFINGEQFPQITPTAARSGEVEIWSIRNDSEMDHPFHLHGMFFRVLDAGGVAPAHAGWKDTVNVPMKSTLRFAVRYGEAGTWMYHCHILEHAERGMMGELVLAAP